MIMKALEVMHQIEIYTNFISFIIIFIGGLYVAILNTAIPQWIRTPLWYMGANAMLTALTIIAQWIYGSDVLFSYDNIGHIGIALMLVNFAVVIVMLFCKTMHKNRKVKSNIGSNCA